MSMYNLLEYSHNYSDTTGSFKDEVTNFSASIVDGNTFKSLKSVVKLL